MKTTSFEMAFIIRVFLKCRQALKWLPLLAAVGLLALWAVPRLRTLEVGDILNWTPRRPWAAALFLIGLFALKGMTFFFPLSVLETAAGLLFPPWIALMVNLTGVAAATTGPFFLGRCQRERMEALLCRYPRLRELRQHQACGTLPVFLLRLAGGLPCDVVSVFFGAAGVPFRVYLPAGLAGMLPHLAAATFLGAALRSPTSPAFWAAAGLNAAISVGALSVWRIIHLRHSI